MDTGLTIKVGVGTDILDTVMTGRRLVTASTQLACWSMDSCSVGKVAGKSSATGQMQAVASWVAVFRCFKKQVAT